MDAKPLAGGGVDPRPFAAGHSLSQSRSRSGLHDSSPGIDDVEFNTINGCCCSGAGAGRNHPNGIFARRRVEGQVGRKLRDQLSPAPYTWLQEQPRPSLACRPRLHPSRNTTPTKTQSFAFHQAPPSHVLYPFYRVVLSESIACSPLPWRLPSRPFSAYDKRNSPIPTLKNLGSGDASDHSLLRIRPPSILGLPSRITRSLRLDASRLHPCHMATACRLLRWRHLWRSTWS